MISTSAIILSMSKSCDTFIAIQFSAGYVNIRKIGSGAVSVSTQTAVKEESRSNPNGRQENENERQGGFARRKNSPTQAKRRLVWATRQPPS
ncbi:MAG: hypothetical protein RB191_20600, partial [Terriglobia bacterium]|nr:hypothetical protein [Terriglobia bacterium]